MFCIIVSFFFLVSKPSRRPVINHKAPPERPSRPPVPPASVIIENKDSGSGSESDQIIVSVESD